MLLKSLKMINFRQFINEEIDFATDSERNVTVIMGENGAGKTTISQAFSWCLYGDTDFDDKLMLNKIVASQMLPNEEKTVKVQLDLVHSGIEYTIITEQSYKKDFSNKLKANNVIRNIAYKNNGQQDYIKPLEIDLTIKQILPKELSRYFFFDGERIGNMSKEIKKGKSQTFALAVRGLLGLSAFISALEHLKPTSKYGVIGSYNESYDSRSNSTIATYTKTIDECQDELDRIEVRLLEIDNEIALATDRCEELTEKIKEFADGERLQKEKEALQKKLLATKASKKNALESMLKQFSSHAPSYFSKSLVKKSLEILSESDLIGKDIPEMHAKTIDYLIKKGECICGNKIEAGNEAYQKLVDLIKYLPPQSIGVIAGGFVKEAEIRTKASADLFEATSKSFALLQEQEDTILEFTKDIKLIEEKLLTFTGAGRYQQELQLCEKTIRDRTSENNTLRQKKGAIEFKKGQAEAERGKLTLLDQTNRKIEVYKAYAQFMYDELQSVYSENETKVREKLEKTINDIFKDIYNGGMSLSIDDKYNIQVIVDDFDDFNTDVETSTAQSISVIFAFISGIIKLARESREADDADAKLLASEPYPLVMDAPLSAFDKRRIKTVCDALPKVAEQVIIFIKDTDGEIAEEHMGAKVGKRYVFDKKNEFETKLV